MKKNKVLHKNPNMVTREIDGETIFIPIYRTSDEINCIYTLNKSASAIWNLIDGKKSLAEIKRELLKKFDTTKAEVNKEIEKFIKDSKEIKALV